MSLLCVIPAFNEYTFPCLSIDLVTEVWKCFIAKLLMLHQLILIVLLPHLVVLLAYMQSLDVCLYQAKSSFYYLSNIFCSLSVGHLWVSLHQGRVLLKGITSLLLTEV